MTKWLGPLAYFGAVFGVEGEAQPGVMGMIASGRGDAVGRLSGVSRVGLAAGGSSWFQGTLSATQQAQTVDMGMIAEGSGAVVASLSTVVPASPVEFSGRAFWRPVSAPLVSRVPKNAGITVQGSGSLTARASAFASLGVVASGSGSMSAVACVSESEEISIDDLAIILALAA